ncbi:MAG: hypothetical protein P4L84_36455 [Isosphaeraceae bacterium]|nr:hypothetical protein [Isosphaeraceae bacterium]
MPEPLADWPRPYYEGPAGKPFLFYVVYGSFSHAAALDAEHYRSNGVYPGLTLAHYGQEHHAEVLDGFREGYPWDDLLRRDPALAHRTREAEECLILQGELDDQADLNYLRDTVGLLAFLLDHGGVVVFDPQIFRWWGADAWRQHVFEPAAAIPGRHVVILNSEEEADAAGPSTWFHTRGMRKFGRPDVSVHNVPAQYQEAIVDLCDRFITLQAFGGNVPEGQEIQMNHLPAGLVCRHEGDVDDPDFNNSHIEIAGALRG